MAHLPLNYVVYPSELSPEVIAAVVHRDDWHCVACGAALQGTLGHHWVLRYRQGIRSARNGVRPSRRRPPNVITVCHLMTRNGCNTRIDGDPHTAEDLGYLVPEPVDPVDQLIIVYRPGVDGAPLYLDDAGAYLSPAVAS